MKTIITTLLFCCLALMLQAQSSKKYKQSIGFSAHSHINTYPHNKKDIQANIGIELEYNRLIFGTKHYIVTGVGFSLTSLNSLLELDRTGIHAGVPYNLTDFSRTLSIPIYYMYQPNSWLLLSTGFKNKIPTYGHTTDRYDFKQIGIPDYRRYVLEYHLGIGSELTYKRIKWRTKGFMNYSFLTSEYLEFGVSTGFFFQF